MAAKRHYDQQALEQDYKQVFGLSMKVLMYSTIAILAFFMLMIVGLGTLWHESPEDFNRDFSDRIDIMYDGLKLTDPKPVKEHH